MFTEWLLAGLILLGALLLGRPWRTLYLLLPLCGLFLLLAAGGFYWQSRLRANESSQGRLHERLPTARTNDYVSSANCRACHPDQYASWHRSYHRTMTQPASPDVTRGEFNEVRLQFDGDDYHLQRRGNEFWAEMVDPDWRLVFALRQAAYERGESPNPPIQPEHRPKVWKQIDMLTGSHHMQAYWVAGDFGNQQYSFPFTYLFEDKRWVPRDEVFLKDPAGPRLLQIWNRNCIRCHATAALPLQSPSTHIFETELAELGIACEACHGPAYEHVKANQKPWRRYALHAAEKGDPTIVNPERLDSKRSSEVCGQCHSVKYIGDMEDYMAHGFRYRPGKKLDDDAPVVVRFAKVTSDARFPESVRQNPGQLGGTFWPDGMVRVSGREYSQLIESACFQRGELSCLSCHSMHKSDPDDQLALGKHGNQACLPCHEKYREKLTAHTHHAENSSGSLCYNCHMPHTTYGLLKAIRSHQISSPNAGSSFKTGRPNACNLCHLDKPLKWTSTNLAKWYGSPEPGLSEDHVKTSAAVLWMLRGDANQRALAAWHMGWQPAREISGTDWIPIHLAQLLTDPYSAVRYVAQRSLKQLPGFTQLHYDYLASPSEQQVLRDKTMNLAQSRIRALEGREAVLFNKDGTAQTNRVTALLKQRDDHSMELVE